MPEQTARESTVLDVSEINCFRSRKTAQCLQDSFHQRIAKHVRAGIGDLPDDWQEQAIPLLVDYGITRSKKRLSVEPEDFSRLAVQAEKLARRRNGGKPVDLVGFVDNLRDAVEIAQVTLEDAEDRAVNNMVADNQDRPAFYDERLFRGEDRVYLELPQPESEIAPRIAEALGAHGYGELDYKGGFIRNPHGDMARIGKALKKYKLTDLCEDFMRDPARADPAMVMISRKTEDVARMSTARDWSSCVVAGSHRFEKHMPEDLQRGTLVAYLVRPNDPEAHEPMARMNLKTYANEAGEEILVPYKVYGKADERFPVFVKSVIDETVNAGKTGTFTLPQTLLTDDLDYQVERDVDGNLYSNLTLMPDPPKQTGRKLPEGTKLGDRIRL